jgi:lipid-A-disaccharide synthase
MLVLFPFEKEIYEREGMDVEFVGHPLRDTARPSKPPGELRDEFGISGEGPVIALLPGSRRAEIERYLPVMAEAVVRLSGTRSKANFILARAATVDRELIERRLGRACPKVSVISGRACDVLAAADLAVVASGTATLEAALLGAPMVVLGAASWLTYIVIKPLSLVSHFSLPNIIAGREIVPELFQREVNPGRVLKEIEALLDQPEKMATMKEELFRVKESFSEGGASLRAAQAVHKRLWAKESGAAGF